MQSRQLSIFEEKPNPILRIHNPLLFAKYGYLDLVAMRMFLVMLSKWDWYNTGTQVIRIALKDVIPKFTGGSHYKQIEKAIGELRAKMMGVKIDTVVNKKRRILVVNIIDSLEYVEGTNYIEGTFGVKIQDFLRELKGQFTDAELLELFSLRKSHAIRLFLIGKSFYPGHTELEFDKDELREMLCGDEAYQEYKIFKRDVLASNLKAIADTTGAMTMEERKVGKSVSRIILRSANPANYTVPQLPDSDTVLLSKSTEDLLVEMKVNLAKIREMIGDGEITEGYALYVIEKLKDEKNLIKPGAAIYNAIVSKKMLAEYQKPKPTPKPVLTPSKSVSEPLPAVADNVYMTWEAFKAEYEEGIAQGSIVKRPTLQSYWYGFKSNGYRFTKLDGVDVILKPAS